MRHTHPPLRIMVEITPKQTCHGPARYKTELIYTRTKASSPDSLELALIMKVLLDAQFAGDSDFHT